MKMGRLEMKRQTWPPSIQVEHLSRKDVLIAHLDYIAESMGLPRPVTQILKRGEAIPGDKVLKRTHSDCGAMVIIPKSGHGSVKWETLHKGPESAIWMSQEFVHTLRALGEWRVVIVGGQSHYIIHSYYNEPKKAWDFVEVTRFLTLEEIR
jgi:hypothetical protein